MLTDCTRKQINNTVKARAQNRYLTAPVDDILLASLKNMTHALDP
jgi:hypothetical protein